MIKNTPRSDSFKKTLGELSHHVGPPLKIGQGPLQWGSGTYVILLYTYNRITRRENSSSCSPTVIICSIWLISFSTVLHLSLFNIFLALLFPSWISGSALRHGLTVGSPSPWNSSMQLFLGRGQVAAPLLTTTFSKWTLRKRFQNSNQECGSSRIYFASASSSYKVSRFQVCFCFQLLSSKCFRFHKNVTASIASTFLPHVLWKMLPLPVPQKVKSFRICFRFQLLSSKCFHFRKNLTTSTSLIQIYII